MYKELVYLHMLEITYKFDVWDIQRTRVHQLPVPVVDCKFAVWDVQRTSVPVYVEVASLMFEKYKELVYLYILEIASLMFEISSFFSVLRSRMFSKIVFLS